MFTPEQSDVLVRPGPRMAEGARLMAQCLADKAGFLKLGKTEAGTAKLVGVAVRANFGNVAAGTPVGNLPL